MYHAANSNTVFTCECGAVSQYWRYSYTPDDDIFSTNDGFCIDLNVRSSPFLVY